jgi:hypothetical protein
MAHDRQIKRKAQCGQERQQGGEANSLEARADHDQRADEADLDRTAAAPAGRLAEKRRRDRRQEQRLDEENGAAIASGT